MAFEKKTYRPGSKARPFLFRWISFLYPIRIAATSSSHNPTLEVVWYNGVQMLNAGNANYSYGNLLKAFREVFRSESFKSIHPATALTLGMGAGCVPHELKRLFPSLEQHAVEIDPVVVDLYHTYFPQVPDLVIHTDDATHFLQRDPQTYDLIIVDLYCDLNVPAEFHAAEFIQSLASHCSPGGMVVFNQVVNSEESRAQLNQLMLHFAGNFKKVTAFNGRFINYFVLAQK